MTISELIQAKSDNKLVSTPLGTGKVNGIGGKFTYVYFQDSPDSVAGKLVEFSNIEIALAIEVSTK